MRIKVIYWSRTGNTKKVAQAIERSILNRGEEVSVSSFDDLNGISFLDYDLIFLGFPSYSWRPPGEVIEYLTEEHRAYVRAGHVQNCSPRIPGKHYCTFCTYSGPHTGINEAIPAALVANQYFDHLGYTILDPIYVVGEFHGNKEFSTLGRLGDITGRPNEKDIQDVSNRVEEILDTLRG